MPNTVRVSELPSACVTVKVTSTGPPVPNTTSTRRLVNEDTYCGSGSNDHSQVAPL